MMIIGIEENFRMSIEDAGDAISKFTYPIFQENINKRPELIASSVAVEINSRFFLATAKHVVEGLNKSLPTYSANSNITKKGDFIKLNSATIFSTDDAGTEFDLCLIDASTVKDEFCFLPEGKITLGSDFRQGSFNVLLGYPLSKNKPTKSINPDENEIMTGFQTVGVKLDSKIEHTHFQGMKENVHIAFKYNLDHKKQILPFPRGMSGCGVWNIPSVYNSKVFNLAGIFIHYHKREKVGFATKARYLIALSKQHV